MCLIVSYISSDKNCTILSFSGTKYTLISTTLLAIDQFVSVVLRTKSSIWFAAQRTMSYLSIIGFVSLAWFVVHMSSLLSAIFNTDQYKWEFEGSSSVINLVIVLGLLSNGFNLTCIAIFYVTVYVYMKLKTIAVSEFYIDC